MNHDNYSERGFKFISILMKSHVASTLKNGLDYGTMIGFN